MRQKFNKIFIVSLLISSFLAGLLFGQEKINKKLPETIAFNGYLTDDSGNVFDNNYYNFTFSIYSESDPTTPVWTEYHKQVFVKDGEFEVILGKGTNPNPLTLKFDDNYTLGIKINNEKEMDQRFNFVSTPYSLGANFAENVSDYSITSEKIAENTIADDKIKNISIAKITSLPSSFGSLAQLKTIPEVMGSDYEWWTTTGNLIYGPERHYLGTRNARDFLIKSWEIQRMFFDTLGNVVMGTLHDSVHYEEIGKSTFTDDAYIKGVLGVGVYPTTAKMHINSTGRTPLKIDIKKPDQPGVNLFQIETTGRTTIRSSVSGNSWDQHNYPLFIDAQTQGISIWVDGNDNLMPNKANGDNNFMSFWTKDNKASVIPVVGFDPLGSVVEFSNIGNMAGRIEGQTIPEYFLDIPNIIHNAFIVTLGVAYAIAWGMASEEPVDILTITVDLAENVAIEAVEVVEFGVTYESGNGDYAEWLEKSSVNEKIHPGDIVGVNGGKISKNTTDAEYYMAISTAPIVLGNTPRDGDTDNFEKVAFMGQIPVRVRGLVNVGDFIIPSGLNDGTGLALAPELMTIDEYPRIIGEAWSSSSHEGISNINVHVGLDNKDIGHVIKKMQSQDQEITNGFHNLNQGIQTTVLETNRIKNNLSNADEKIESLLNKLGKENYKLSKQ